jgi:hypothetical protein
MKIFHQYDNPLEVGVLMNDRHFQAKYLEQNKIPYNSFILGSSRSHMYTIRDWKKYLPADANCFHLGVNDESIWGMYRKLKYVDEHQYAIKHCLLALDPRLLRDIENNDAHIFRDHPIISGETYLEYYKFFFLAFIQPNFLKSYYEWSKTHKFNQNSMALYMWNEHFTYDKVTGDIFYSEYDSLRAALGDKYYTDLRKDVFYTRDTVAVKQKVKVILSVNTIALLHHIKDIFDKHKTDYRIIINPNYDQIAMSSPDLDTLKAIFGTPLVTNYSGINSITNDMHNYYEFKHHLPTVADSLMNIAYHQ